MQELILPWKPNFTSQTKLLLLLNDGPCSPSMDGNFLKTYEQRGEGDVSFTTQVELSV